MFESGRTGDKIKSGSLVEVSGHLLNLRIGEHIRDNNCSNEN